MKKLMNGTTRVALVLAMLTTGTFAEVHAAAATQGTIVRVQKSTVDTPEIAGAGGTDNPLQTQYYQYDISVKVGDRSYVGRYDSQFDFLLDSFAPDHMVGVRVEKGAMYLDSQGDSIKTTIVSRKRDRDHGNQMASN